LDAGGLAAIEKLVMLCEKNHVQLVFSAWEFQPLKTLAKARGDSLNPLKPSFPTLFDAINNAQPRGKCNEAE
jgi:SulP family sulfate permease